MISKKFMASVIVFSLLTGSAHAKRPETFLGKCGASVLQVVNRHPYLSTIPLATVAAVLADRPDSEELKTGVTFMATWIVSGMLASTITKIIMKNCDIDPIE